MSPRSRPTLALALATVVGSAATPAIPAGADDPEVPLVERCYVEGLTVEEAAAGEESDVWCEEVPADDPVARRGLQVLVELYDAGNGTGTPLILEGTTCTGLVVNWGPSHPWNNRISSTDLVVCGTAKHYDAASFAGTPEVFSGPGFSSFTGNVNIDNKTTSIEYA